MTMASGLCAGIGFGSQEVGSDVGSNVGSSWLLGSGFGFGGLAFLSYRVKDARSTWSRAVPTFSRRARVSKTHSMEEPPPTSPGRSFLTIRLNLPYNIHLLLVPIALISLSRSHKSTSNFILLRALVVAELTIAADPMPFWAFCR